MDDVPPSSSGGGPPPPPPPLPPPPGGGGGGDGDGAPPPGDANDGGANDAGSGEGPAAGGEGIPLPPGGGRGGDGGGDGSATTPRSHQRRQRGRPVEQQQQRQRQGQGQGQGQHPRDRGQGRGRGRSREDGGGEGEGEEEEEEEEARDALVPPSPPPQILRLWSDVTDGLARHQTERTRSAPPSASGDGEGRLFERALFLPVVPTPRAPPRPPARGSGGGEAGEGGRGVRRPPPPPRIFPSLFSGGTKISIRPSPEDAAPAAAADDAPSPSPRGARAGKVDLEKRTFRFWGAGAFALVCVRLGFRMRGPQPIAGFGPQRGRAHCPRANGGFDFLDASPRADGTPDRVRGRGTLRPFPAARRPRSSPMP
ncbi:hypothetical protein ACHAWF_017891 [Thalassiosira exigua]